MRRIYILTIVFLTSMGTFHFVEGAGRTGHRNFSELRQHEMQEWERFRKRFTEEYADFLSSGTWALTHVAESKSEIEETLNLLQVLFNSLAKNDPAVLNEIGGVNGFKEKFLKLMKSNDDTVSGFAATVLGISGDLNYAPQIALLLQKKDNSSTDEHAYPTITIRGRAATALGLLGAKEYTHKIALLLQSKNEYDRAGAAIALGHLNAKEHANDVVSLLLNKDFSFRDDDSPIYSLMQMGVAANYKKEIAQVLEDEFRTETSQTAAYALAHLGANEYVKEIAKLLNEEYRKGYAAKALAIMNAREYAGRIALLLNDKSSLSQKDALLALGILKAKEYAPKAAELLNAKEDFVRYYAAVSLVLMGASEYAKDVVPIIVRTHQSGVYLNEGEFHPLVKEEALEVNNRFKALLAQMESQKK